MLTIGYAPIDIDVSQGEQIAPDDVIDAVKTLAPTSKVCIPISPPGQGPEHFLHWAIDELAEAEAAQGNVATRKAFNCSVLAKCSVECLIDWYLNKYMLTLTLPQHASLVKKLHALQASDRLGIGLTLFESVMFELRNDAIHQYSHVDLILAKKSVELAKLTVRNCVHADDPGLAPIFYGTIELYQGREAVEKYVARDPRSAPYLNMKDVDGLFLSSIGTKGEVSVFIDRNGPDTQVLLLTSDGEKSADVRFCPIDHTFGTQRLQELFQLLEIGKPQVINVALQHVHTVVGSLANRRSKPKVPKA